MGKVSNLSYARDESARDVAKRLGLQKNDFVETKTFEPGYRGSWFQCQIKGIETSYRNHVRYKLQFVHFPGEALHWCQAYQKRHRGQEDSFELMVRPNPPPLLRESEKKSNETLPRGTFIVSKPWQIGDFVDWYNKDAWWEGSLVGFAPNGKFKVALFEPSEGEGGTFEVEDKDLRPTVSWAGAGKWTINISKINGRAAGEVFEIPNSTLTQEFESDLMKEKEEVLIEVGRTQNKEPDVKIFPSLEKLRDAVRNLNGEAYRPGNFKSPEFNPNEIYLDVDGQHGKLVTPLVRAEIDMITPLVPEKVSIGTPSVSKEVGMQSPLVDDVMATPVVPEEDVVITSLIPEDVMITPLIPKEDANSIPLMEGDAMVTPLMPKKDIVITPFILGAGTTVIVTPDGIAIVTSSIPEDGTVPPSIPEEDGTVTPLIPEEDGMVTPLLPEDGTVTPSILEEDGTVTPSIPEEGGRVTPLILEADSIVTVTPDGIAMVTSSISEDVTVTPLVLEPEAPLILEADAVVSVTPDGVAMVTSLMPEDVLEPAGTTDSEDSYSDLEYIRDILYIKRLKGGRRNKKFMRYRRQIKKYISITRSKLRTSPRLQTREFMRC